LIYVMFVDGGVISPSCGHWPTYLFLSDSRIVSHLPFAWQLANQALG